MTFDELLEMNNIIRRGSWITLPTGEKCRLQAGATTSVYDDALDHLLASIAQPVFDDVVSLDGDYLDLTNDEWNPSVPEGILDWCIESNLYIDGRIYDYNEDIIDMFWRFEADDIVYNITKNVIIVARKGKDWYVIPEPEYLIYGDDIPYLPQSHIDKAYKAKDYLESVKQDLILRCQARNSYEQLPDRLKSQIEVWDFEDAFYDHKSEDKALESLLWDGQSLPEVYPKIAGFKVVVDEVGYALDFGREGLYHFTISELFNQGFRDAAKNAFDRRRQERLEKAKIFERASKVFVSFSDSLEAGNCRAGSEAFCRKYNLNPENGYRGDFILRLESNVFTLRAVNTALSRRNNEK